MRCDQFSWFENRSGISLRHLLIIAPLLSLTSGCSFRTQTTGMAVDHNEFVAQTTNSQTVLNILRAREREPMHFTSFSKVAGNMRAQGNIGSGVALNGDNGVRQATNTTAVKTGVGGALLDQTDTLQSVVTSNIGATNFTPQLGLQINTGTDFDISVNANDEFYKGILGTLPASLLIHYLRQGFPADLLSHLVIGRIEFFALITAPDGTITKTRLRDIRNAPDEKSEAGSFATAMRCRHLTYAVDAQPSRAVPLSDVAALSGVAPELFGRIKAANTTMGPYFIDIPARTEFKLALSAPSEEECAPIRAELESAMMAYAQKNNIAASGTKPDSAKSSVRPRSGLLASSESPFVISRVGTDVVSEGISGQGGATFQSEGYFTDQLADKYKGDLLIEMSLRSAEGILYYLGEYVRNPALSPLLKDETCNVAIRNGYCLPVIRVLPAAQIPSNQQFVSVLYRGKRYAVPLSGSVLNADAGRSSQTVSLVQQLLNLNKTAKDLPTTPLVRIAN